MVDIKQQSYGIIISKNRQKKSWEQGGFLKIPPCKTPLFGILPVREIAKRTGKGETDNESETENFSRVRSRGFPE